MISLIFVVGSFFQARDIQETFCLALIVIVISHIYNCFFLFCCKTEKEYRRRREDKFQ